MTRMEKRNCRRIDTSLTTSICCEPYHYQTTITNISEKGVCIYTTMCFPIGTECKLFISGKDGMLEVQACVKHLVKKEDFNDAMGFELLNPSMDYIEFVNTLRHSL